MSAETGGNTAEPTSPDDRQLPAGWRWDPTHPLEADDGPVTQPCPDWCDDEPGHPYTWSDDDGAGHCREHMRWYGTDVVVTAFYEAAGKDGPKIVREPPAVRMPVEQPDALTGTESRALAGSLLAAADGLGKISQQPKEGHP